MVNFIILSGLLLLVHKFRWALFPAICYALAWIVFWLLLGVSFPVILFVCAILFGLAWLWFWLLTLTEETNLWYWVLGYGGFIMVFWPYLLRYLAE